MSGILNLKDKGISPLIAAVLLIAFTMTVAAILATWAQTFGQQRIEEAGERGAEAIECPALSVRIESASWQNEEVQIVAWNTGDYNLTDINLIIYNQSSPNIPNELQLNNPNATISPGDFEVLKAGGITNTPDRLNFLSQRDRCQDVQPLYTCDYTDGQFAC